MHVSKTRILLFISFALSFALVSCSSKPPISVEQKQVLQTRFISGISYADLFEVIVSMLKNSGYQTTRAEKEEGVIVGTLRQNIPFSFTTRFGRDSHAGLREGERLEAVINVKSADADNVAVRLSLQQLPEYSLGVVAGQEILEPKAYEKFFAHLQALVRKHQANSPKK